MEESNSLDLHLTEALEEFKDGVDIKTRQFPRRIPDEILTLLGEIKQSGRNHVKWNLLLPVVATLIHLECNNFYQKNGFIGPLPETFVGRYSTLLSLLESFQSPPWTLQRLIEVLLQPRQSYSSTHKFMNSLEKLLSVTSTLDQLE